MMQLYLTRQEPDFFKREGVVLHFAPEPHICDLVARNPGLRRFSTDCALHVVQQYPDGAFQADMQYLPVASDSIDIVFCLHVLEHVPDDRQGIAEMKRILKPGGVAYIMVPFMMGWKETVEFSAPDPTIYDHVRGYAPSDFKNRLGVFDYDEVSPLDLMTRDEVRRYRIPTDSQIIYRCVKR
jgi:SAM-dependent methyltransferase